MFRKNISSDAPWEKKVGYSRAVIYGQNIEVTGTVAVHQGKVVGEGDVEEQTRFILEKIKSVLAQAGSSMSEIVRTRIYLTDISDWEKVGKIHGEYFHNIRPATTMLEVSALISPEFLIEIEAQAYLD